MMKQGNRGTRAALVCLTILMLATLMPTGVADWPPQAPERREWFDGHLACSIGTPAARFVGCDYAGWLQGDDDYLDDNDFRVEKHPYDEVVVGIRWNATSDAAKTLYAEVYDPYCDCPRTAYRRVNGESPMVIPVTQQMMSAGVGASAGIAVKVAADLGLVQDQHFEVVIQEISGKIPEGYDPFAIPRP